MAFDAQGLQVIATGGALAAGSVQKIYSYITNDADTVVEANAYFDTTDMRTGDLVIASLDVDGTPEVKHYIVSAGTGNADSNDVALTAMLIA